MTPTTTTLRERTSVVLARLSWLVVAPGVLGHEAAHALVGWLLGAHVSATRLEDGRPAIQMAWPPETAEWCIRFAHLAPLLCSPVAIGVGAGSLWLAARIANSVTVFLVAAALVVGNLLAYLLPSAEDLSPGGDA